MSKRSSQSVAPELERQLYAAFFQMLADMRNAKEVETFLKYFLSESELSIYTKRFAVAVMLEQGKSYEYIREALKVSTATISSIAEHLRSDGISLALHKLKVERWADVMSEKLMQMFGGNSKK